MKKTKILAFIFFLVALAGFLWYLFNTYRNMEVIGPVITMDEGHKVVSVDAGEEEMLAGITAYDATDGDVTASLGIETISMIDESAGRRIQVVAFDKDNHVSRTTRTITYSDYRHPTFGLTRALRFPVSTQPMNILTSLRAYDCLDGDLSGQIAYSLDSSIQTGLAGDYPVIFEVTNSAGDKQELPVTVTLYENAVENMSPKILLNQFILNIKKGEDYDPLDYVEMVSYQGKEYELTDKSGTFGIDTAGLSAEELVELNLREPEINRRLIQVIDGVDRDVPGVYEIKYLVAASTGIEGSIRLVVVVEEDP